MGFIEHIVLERIVLFFVSIGLMLGAWLVFLFFNKHLSHMQPGIIQTVLGTANSLAIIIAYLAIFNYFALSFSVGLMIAIAILIVRMLFKKFMPGSREPIQAS